MKNGMNGKSNANSPIIGSANSINNWARIGSALASLTRGISTPVSTSPGENLLPDVMPRASLLTAGKYHLPPEL